MMMTSDDDDDEDENEDEDDEVSWKKNRKHHRVKVWAQKQV